MTRELEVARQAAEAAGRSIVGHFRQSISIQGKDGADPTFNLVTNADLAAEKVIFATIRESLPDHEILGEESNAADVSAEHLWIIDPIDGTNNFVHGIPHFAISIAYYRAGLPQCGVVHNPITGDWYVTTRRGGAFYNGQRVNVAQQSRFEEALIGVGFYYDRGLMMEATLTAIRDLFHRQIRGIRRFGAASLDLCYVGCGMFTAFFEFELSYWDFAAGRLFVEEAGGRVTDCLGRPMPAGKSSILASNGRMHDEVLAVIRPLAEGLRH